MVTALLTDRQYIFYFLKKGFMAYIINSEVERADRLIIDTKSRDKWTMR